MNDLMDKKFDKVLRNDPKSGYENETKSSNEKEKSKSVSRTLIKNWVWLARQERFD